MEWQYSAAAAGFVAKQVVVEGYLTHNGDFDFFTLHGVRMHGLKPPWTRPAPPLLLHWPQLCTKTFPCLRARSLSLSLVWTA